MAADPDKKAKSKARSDQYQRRKAKEIAKRAAEEAAEMKSVSQDEAVLMGQLALLEKRCKGRPTDADADIDWAYRNMALASVQPLDAPSTAAWSWYVFSRSEPNEFLKITQKREDAKAKQAGTVTNQRMEDDKRQQFAMIDRIERQLTLDIKTTVDSLMDKFPREVLRLCKKHKEAWASFVAEECQ